jgi:hypothetical protein
MLAAFVTLTGPRDLLARRSSPFDKLSKRSQESPHAELVEA